MGKFVEGTVAGKRRWAARLYSLQVAAEVAPFQAGQFTKLALDINGEMVGHTYSFINALGEMPLEFYFIQVPGGLLTQRLAALEVGDAVWVAPQAAGFLTLSEVPDGKHLCLLSTGTGIGPFLSILKTEAPWKRFERIVLAHAVRHADEPRRIFLLVAAAWKVLYHAQRHHILAVSDPYARIRHPQYAGFMLIMSGFLLEWPTIVTLLMFPVLVWMYVRLARTEERDAEAEFGEQWREYAAHTPRFFPRGLSNSQSGGTK